MNIKYTVMGFSQVDLLENNLDVIDAMLLRFFIDFKDTEKMYSEIIENDKFYWIKYEAVKENIPIINLDKRAIARRLKKMSDCNILKQYIKKQGGTYSMYAVGCNYSKLILNTDNKEEIEGRILKYNGVDLKVQTKNSSIKETNLLKLKSNIYTSFDNDVSKRELYFGITQIRNHIDFICRKYNVEEEIQELTKISVVKFNRIFKEQTGLKHSKLSEKQVLNIIDYITTLIEHESHYRYSYEDMEKLTEEFAYNYFRAKRKYYSMQEFFSKENIDIYTERTK